MRFMFKIISIWLIAILITHSLGFAANGNTKGSTIRETQITDPVASHNFHYLAPKSSFRNVSFIQSIIFAFIFMLVFFGGSHLFAQQRNVTEASTGKTVTISSFSLNGKVAVAFEDLRSILPDSHRKGLHVSLIKEEGHYYNYLYLDNSLDWHKDPGAEIIFNLVNSPNRYEYMVADTVTTENRSNLTGKRVTRAKPFTLNILTTPETDKNNQLINAVVTVKNPGSPTVYDSPLNGLTGQVTLAVSIDSLYTDATRTKLKERPSLVFHELWECFLRGDEKKNYKDAHNMAIQKEKSLPNKDLGKRKSVSPGRAHTSSKGLVVKKKTEYFDPKKNAIDLQPKNNGAIEKSS